MTGTLTDILLAVAVAAFWLASVGFIRLRDALDRLHCATFLGVTAGPAITLAGFLDLGAQPSAVKILFVLVSTTLSGAALSHAAGRALWFRGQDEKDAP